MEEIKKESERLVDLFKFENGYGICEHTGIKGITEEQAKQCVLICLDEMIDENNSILEMLNLHGNLSNKIRVKLRIYDLNQVKEYIEQNY